jgi:hypothetical protein
MRFMTLLAATALVALTPSARAQTAAGTPAFRVPIGSGTTASSGPGTYAWMQNVGTCSNACGNGTRPTTYQCQNISEYDFGGAGYGSPEAESLCSATAAKPNATSDSCTNYSGCSYDWVKPPVSTTILPKPGNPDGGTFPPGAIPACSYAKRVYAPYCKRDGTPSVTLPAGDHAFCRNDLPDYNDVASNSPDALGYDRNQDDSSGCVIGARDHEWKFDSVKTQPSTCSANPVTVNSFRCVQKYNGATKPDSFCAGVTVPAPGINQAMPANYSSCTKTWESSAWSAYSSTCSDAAVRTRTVLCRRSDGTAVADGECSGTKPATSETSQNLTDCGHSWSTPSAWTYASGCSSNTTRTRTTSCVRSDGKTVADSSCSASARPSTSETGVSNFDSCTYVPRDQGSTACANSQKQQYWDCTRSDGQTGFPANYCGKTNPETQTCTMPPVYTYAPTNRGETACSNGQKTVYWDCTRNDGATGYPASMCGKTNPETQGCLSYTPRSRGESACVASRKDLYWDCLGSDGNAYPAANCGKTNPENVACTMQYTWNWSAGGWGATTGGCPGSSTRSRAVSCVRNDGYVDSDQFCNAGARPASTETTACPYTWSWATGAWSGYNSGCSASATRTRSVVCQRNDGYVDSDQFCNAASRPGASETTSVYSSCTYSSQQDGGFTECQNSTQSVALRCQRSDGTYVANSNCGTADRATQSCNSTPTICAISPRYGFSSADMRGDGTNQSNNDGTFYYSAPFNSNGSDYPCGRTMTGRSTIRSNGVNYNLGVSCSSSGGPSCDNAATQVIDGVTYRIRVWTKNYNNAQKQCTGGVTVGTLYQGNAIALPSC